MSAPKWCSALFVLSITLSWFSSSAVPQSEPEKDFHFLSVNKTVTLEKELNDAAKTGFRLAQLSKAVDGANLAALVTRQRGSKEAQTYEYKVLATRRISTMEKELEETAGQGWEIRGITSVERVAQAMLGIGDETVIVLERAVENTARRFVYKLLSTQREKTMTKEMAAEIAAGYVPVEMVRGQDNNAASMLLGPKYVYTVVLGKPAAQSPPQAASREFQFLSTNKVSTMEKEMNSAAKEGYRFDLSAPPLLTMMACETAERGKTRYEYKLLATRRIDTMRKELDEFGAQGFRYRATSNGLGGLVTVLERDLSGAAKENRYEYKLLNANTSLTAAAEQKPQGQINEALTAGYRFLNLTTIGGYIFVLERNLAARGQAK